MSVAQDAKKLSFNSQLEQHNDPKIIVTTEEVHEKSEFNESKQRLTPMDESKSIENFFTSSFFFFFTQK